MTESEPLELASHHWLSPGAAFAIRISPAALSLLVALVEVVLRPGEASVVVGAIAFLLALVWIRVKREPYLIGSILCLGLDFAYVLKAPTSFSRDSSAVLEGLVLYLVHSLGSLSGVCAPDALIDRRVVAIWAQRSAEIGAAGALAGAITALIGSVVVSHGSSLSGDARGAFGVVVLGAIGLSLALLWPWLIARGQTRRVRPTPPQRRR